MNILISNKGISFIKSLVYLSAFLACIFVVYSFAGKVDSSQTTQKFLFRVMTYNIHHGEGIDGVVDFERIANIINQENPDILLLQEVDVNISRSGNVNVPVYLSEKTSLENRIFGKNLTIENGEYGNAILTKFPVTNSMNVQFEKIGSEQRGVSVAEIKILNRSLLILNSHFDHSEDDSERVLYAEKVITNILPEYNTDAVLFGGDFNDIPTSQMYHKLTEKFKDGWVISGQDEGNTIPANQPTKRIDYIFFKGNLKADSTWVPKTEVSDHLPVVSDFILVDE